MYDFDERIERKGSRCLKYDRIPGTHFDDTIPLWVADMDFKTPDFIVDALRRRLEHPVFGYMLDPEGYYDTIAQWVKQLHGWSVDPSHIRFVPGIIKGLRMVLSVFCQPGDKIVIQPPVYHPFRIVPEMSDMQVVTNPLIPVEKDGVLCGYEMDFAHLESILDERTKVLVLANPHNPAGICWSRETLQRLAAIAARHGVLVVSDEIHAEMALFGHRHIPFASVCPEAAAHSITFMAPSKTFNIAGICSAYTIVEEPTLRERFFHFLASAEFDDVVTFPGTATMAAYRQGEPWRRELVAYLEGNVDFVDGFLREHCPGIHCLRPQASFLIWLDCRQLGLPQQELVRLFEEKAHLALNDGTVFGVEGTGFMRLNVGCPRSTLREALGRLEKAL